MAPSSFHNAPAIIAAAFVENPEALVDTACTQALIPVFLLPDGNWSK
jgi:hypothetical protein